MTHFNSPSVVSIASACPDGSDLQKAILQSDYIRHETMRRCRAIASYDSKPTRWKNRYYDTIRKKVIAELENSD